MAQNSVSHGYIFQKLLEQGRSPKDEDYVTAFQSEVLCFFELNQSSLTDKAADELLEYAKNKFHKQLHQFYIDHKSRVETIKKKHKVRKFIIFVNSFVFKSYLKIQIFLKNLSQLIITYFLALFFIYYFSTVDCHH